MTGLVQVLSDLKLIVTTDRRLWAVTAFLAVAFLVWSFTSSWREPEEPKPEELWRVKVEEEHVQDVVKSLSKEVKEGQEESQYLKDYLKRVTNELSSGSEEIDWHANTLINKLNSMSEKVDILANKVGDAALEKQKLEAKIAQSKKKRVKKKKVDGAEL